MDAGVAAEYDAPAALLSNASGIFTSMVNETGKATAAYLRGVAAGTAAPGDAPGAGAGPNADGSAAPAVSRSTSAVDYPALSRSGSEAQNGLLVAQKVLREAAEADHLLSHLVHYMEDKVRIPPPPRPAASLSPHLRTCPSPARDTATLCRTPVRHLSSLWLPSGRAGGTRGVALRHRQRRAFKGWTGGGRAANAVVSETPHYAQSVP